MVEIVHPKQVECWLKLWYIFKPLYLQSSRTFFICNFIKAHQVDFLVIWFLFFFQALLRKLFFYMYFSDLLDIVVHVAFLYTFKKQITSKITQISQA